MEFIRISLTSTHNHSYFYFNCLSGELCVEGRNHEQQQQQEDDEVEETIITDYINVINTRNRIAKVDGRNIHWVRSWKGGDRYSLIFYDTTSRYQTSIIESGICKDYLNKQLI